MRGTPVARIVFLFASLLSACAAPHIAEADEKATQAWNDLLTAYRAEAETAHPIAERLRTVAPAEHLAATTIEQAAREIAQGCRQADPRDSRAVQMLDRWHRVLVAQRSVLTKITHDHREVAEDTVFSEAIPRFDEAREAVTKARDRYQAAALAYNRALRTFPESVVNNMFLKQKPRAFFQIDRQTNANAGAGAR